jgi:5S rRNA maturation endonuclease (ribonuclease M5)
LWSRAVVVDLVGCGCERGRLLIPIRDRSGGLRGVLRYAPWHDRAPKMLAVPGTRLGLIPHPAAEPSEWIVLVEGPPDLISARSRGLPAIAVPGDHTWETQSARLLADRRVSVVMDSDHAGREAAARIAGDLRTADVDGTVIDLAPGRDDRYDLTDWFSRARQLAGGADPRGARVPRRTGKCAACSATGGQAATDSAACSWPTPPSARSVAAG